MKYKKIPLVLCILFLLWFSYPAALKFRGGVIYSFPEFSKTFYNLFIAVNILLLLFALIAAQTNNETGQSHNKSFYWYAGFFIPLVLALVVALYVNPHARFTGNRFPPVTPGARLAKAMLFENFIQTSRPEIIIFGSSRAFTLSPEYIEEMTGYKAFNMSVEGGSTGDFVVETNHILSLNTTTRVAVIDVSTETFAVQFLNAELQPLPLLPYMPIKQGIDVAKISLQDTLGLQSLSDSLFLLQLPDANAILGTWSFQQNGMSIRKPLTEEQYQENLEETIQKRVLTQHCKILNPIAQQRFEELITLAKNNGIGIVLYISPIHEQFFLAAYENNPDLFNTCRENQLSYLTSLTSKYENVQFRDLLTLETVVHLDDLGFYDAIHITPYAGELVLNELTPLIEQAYQWSIENQ